jgi:hypothetical protein
MPVTRKHLRRNLGETGHLLTGTLHDLRAIDPKKKVEGRCGPLVRQRVQQGLEVVQPAFVEHLTEGSDDGAKDGPILLPPGRVTYAGTVAVAVDLE